MSNAVAFLAALRKTGYFTANAKKSQLVQETAKATLGIEDDAAITQLINELVKARLIRFRYSSTPEQIRENHREAFTQWQISLTPRGHVALWARALFG